MNYFSIIKGTQETEAGTDLLIHIPNELLRERIIQYKAYNVEVRIDDGRTISNEQRKKIYATIKDISLYTGDDPEYLKEFLKFDYCGESGEKYFSLSDCSIDTAREFISHLIDFILKENIPLSELAINRTDDIDRYLYGCIKYRRCCITGKSIGVDIHHCEGSRVGMGGNRKKISNIGRELMALSREWHSRVHNEGEEAIFKAYKIYGVEIGQATLRALEITDADIT